MEEANNNNNNNVVLLNFWPSSYGMRVKIALAEKGIEYEAKEEENLWGDKSPLLLEMNPVYKTVPVLIHNGKSICESLVIVQYIDDTWHGSSPLLPSDPYERSQARFWADYICKKLYNIAYKVWKVKGEEQEAFKKEFMECLKTLEGELGDEPYFGGDTFGYVDVVLVSLSPWFYTIETFANFCIETESPKIVLWVKRCMERESVSRSLPDPQQIYGFALEYKQKFGIE
ncbi:unnamed protein product [Camellia sinensis]